MLANRQVSLSHQVNDGGKLIFVGDFLAGKQAEGAQLKAEQEAKVAEAKAQAEHQRQKELVELDIARTQAAAPPPPVEGAPPVLGGSPIPAPVPMAPVQGSSSGVLEVVFALVVIGALGVGGWFLYQKYGATNEILGSWSVTESTLSGQAKLNVVRKWEFIKNGSFQGDSDMSISVEGEVAKFNLIQTGTWEMSDGELTVVNKDVKFIPDNDTARELVELGEDPNKYVVVGKTTVYEIVSISTSTMILKNDGKSRALSRVGN
jgi:hypothetical protein